MLRCILIKKNNLQVTKQDIILYILVNMLQQIVVSYATSITHVFSVYGVH
jgi:hypothetical protein